MPQALGSVAVMKPLSSDLRRRRIYKGPLDRLPVNQYWPTSELELEDTPSVLAMFLPAIVLFYAVLVKAAVVPRDVVSSKNPHYDPYNLGCDFIMSNPPEHGSWSYHYFTSYPADLTLQWCAPLLPSGPLCY